MFSEPDSHPHILVAKIAYGMLLTVRITQQTVEPNVVIRHFCCDVCKESFSCSVGHCNVQLKILVGDKNIYGK